MNERKKQQPDKKMWYKDLSDESNEIPQSSNSLTVRRPSSHKTKLKSKWIELLRWVPVVFVVLTVIFIYTIFTVVSRISTINFSVSQE